MVVEKKPFEVLGERSPAPLNAGEQRRIFLATQKISKSIEKRTVSPWNKDSKVGVDDSNTSLSVILNWWVQEGNYRKYCRKDNIKGEKKIQFCEKLSQDIEGVTSIRRTPASIKTKIAHMEDCFKKTHEWVNNTG